MVAVSIFAVISLCTGLAFFGECGFFTFNSICCLNVEDFFGKDFGGQGWKGSDSAFEIISTG